MPPQATGLELVQVPNIGLVTQRTFLPGIQAVFTAEQLPAVTSRVDLGFHTEMKILVVPPFAEQVTGLRSHMSDEYVVLNPPVAGLVGMRFPTGQVLVVEERDPA